MSGTTKIDGELAIAPLDPNAPETQALVDRHLALMYEITPPEHVHAMDLSGLVAAGARLLGIRRGGTLIGMGAVKMIGDGHAELKSMHVVSAARGSGAAAALLAALFDEARAMGGRRISLETGSQPGFVPAVRLYARHGFETCSAFADYPDDPASVFMTRSLD